MDTQSQTATQSLSDEQMKLQAIALKVKTDGGDPTEHTHLYHNGKAYQLKGALRDGRELLVAYVPGGEKFVETRLDIMVEPDQINPVGFFTMDTGLTGNLRGFRIFERVTNSGPFDYDVKARKDLDPHQDSVNVRYKLLIDQVHKALFGE